MGPTRLLSSIRKSVGRRAYLTPHPSADSRAVIVISVAVFTAASLSLNRFDIAAFRAIVFQHLRLICRLISLRFDDMWLVYPSLLPLRVELRVVILLRSSFVVCSARPSLYSRPKSARLDFLVSPVLSEFCANVDVFYILV